MKEPIWTVFPESGNGEMPQDFETYEEAKEYAETLDCKYSIEEAL